MLFNSTQFVVFFAIVYALYLFARERVLYFTLVSGTGTGVRATSHLVAAGAPPRGHWHSVATSECNDDRCFSIQSA